MDRKNVLWAQLNKKMSNKRTKAGKATGPTDNALPREIVVQRLAAEPDTKQTFKPVQPREFVPFNFKEMSLNNLKIACSTHFGLSARTCDVLVSNKGPSCNNINQIQHRKDKVYLVRFVAGNDLDDMEVPLGHSDSGIDSEIPCSTSSSRPPVFELHQHAKKRKLDYPESISIETLLKAGKFVKPVKKDKHMIYIEKFDVNTNSWISEGSFQALVEEEKFASGGFRNAFKAENLSTKSLWVIKQYNEKTKGTVKEVFSSSLEEITRKQVQMHSVAKAITDHFSRRVPSKFGNTFQYNTIYYSSINDIPSTVEEFVPGDFQKWINNNGHIVPLGKNSTNEEKDIADKAQCLVHFSYEHCKKKLMLLDIQGSNYTLYDPEISTTDLLDDSNEVYFCVGNLSIESIQNFFSEHVCNKFCRLMIPSEKDAEELVKDCSDSEI